MKQAGREVSSLSTKYKKLLDDFNQLAKEKAKVDEELKAEKAGRQADAEKAADRIAELDEEVIDSTALNLVKGRAMMAYEVYHKGATKETCKNVVDEWLGGYGSLADLLEGEEAPAEASTMTAPCPEAEGPSGEKVNQGAREENVEAASAADDEAIAGPSS